MKLYNLFELSEPRDALVIYMVKAILRWLEGDPIPYLWGGQKWDVHDGGPNHPHAWNGVDCSGFVILGLIEAGILPLGTDTTAAGLRDMFEPTDDPKPGDLVFFGRNRTTHVGMIFQSSRRAALMVEAGGGGKSITTPKKAMAKNAYVSVSPVNRRSDIRGYRDIERKK